MEFRRVVEELPCRDGRFFRTSRVRLWQWSNSLRGQLFLPIREYYLPHARISPPDELLPLIWAKLDKWSRESFAHGRIEDMAASNFTDLLRLLRQVILQDSVELRSLFSQNTHEVSRHESFAEQVRSELHAPEVRRMLRGKFNLNVPTPMLLRQSTGRQTLCNRGFMT